ncbi:MAG: phage portal protein, partial [Hyphomicrobiales bacterium]|nr:phage portal protein [Hyphomicrobiales bacterium]
MKLNLFGLSVDIGKRGIENPATSIREGSEWLLDSLGGHTAASGVRVNEQTAMRSSAVWGCIRVLSSSIGSLPLVVYERTDKGRRVAREHHLYSMLHDAPNQSMSSMTWRQVQQVHVTATGNSYAYIKRGERTKRPQEIIPLMPSSVTP